MILVMVVSGYGAGRSVLLGEGGGFGHELWPPPLPHNHIT